MHSPTLPTSLRRSWFLHSRTFWLGLLVSAFFIWLTVDSHLNTSVIRTIHRGSWRDWSSGRTIPGGTPGESGSIVLESAGGAVGVKWLDQLAMYAGYSGNDERSKSEPGFRKIWLPKVIHERDSLMRRRGFFIPTWLFLAAWLGIWLRLLVKSRHRHRSHLTPAATPAS